MNGLTAYALSKKYTNDTVDGLGYLKGAPCTIKSTTETDDGVVIVFEWTGTSGVTQTSSILIKNGEDGQAQTITTARTVDDDGVVITVVNPDGSIASTANIYDGDSGEVTSIDWSKIENRPFVTLSVDDFEVDENGVLSVVTNGEGNKIDSISVNGVNVEIDTNKNVDIVVPTISAEQDNALVQKNDGLYVPTVAEAKVSSKANNIISSKEDGLFAEDTIVEVLVDGNTVPIVDKKVDIALKTINDLENYYLKTEIYSADEIDDLLSTITTLNILAVDTLPTENISTTTIYLVSNGDTEENNIRDEYICLDSTVPTWEKIGSTKVDLTDYVKSEKLTEELENYVLKVDGKGLSTHDLTDELLEKITQNDNIIEISKADYDLLTDEEKRDKIYYVYDDENGVLTWSTLSEKPFESIDVESFAVGEDGVLSLKDGYVKTDDVEQMFKDELYISTTTSAHYELSDSTVPNALEVVADGTATDGQIEQSSVTDLEVEVGNYVVWVDEVTTTDTKYALKADTYSKDEVDTAIANAQLGGEEVDLSEYIKEVDADEKYVLDEEIKVLSESDVLALIGLSDTELEGLNQILVDTSIVTNKTWSSSKIYSELANTLDESKAYTLQELSKAIGASYKVVTSVDQMTDSKVLYLLKDADSGMYNIYVFDEDTTSAELIGSFEINLDNFYTKTESEDLFATKADITANYATKTELQDAIDNATVEISEETDNLLEEKNDGLYVGKNYIPITQNEYNNLSDEDKQKEIFYYITDADASGIDIVTTIDTTATDDTVPSAKTVYDKLNKYVPKTDVITDLDYSSVTDTQVVSARALYNRGLNGYYGKNILSGVTNLNDFVTIGKYETVMNTTNIENFPPTNKGITRFSIKVEFIVKGMYRQEIEFQAGSVNEGIWHRSLIDGNWSSWRKVSTSTVEDTIAYGVSGEKFGNGANLGLYTVKNGWCFYSIEATPNADVANGDIVASGLPKPRIDFYLSLTCLGGTYSALLNTNGELKIYYPSYVTASRIDSCFCYPVAES